MMDSFELAGLYLAEADAQLKTGFARVAAEVSGISKSITTAKAALGSLPYGVRRAKTDRPEEAERG